MAGMSPRLAGDVLSLAVCQNNMFAPEKSCSDMAAMATVIPFGVIIDEINSVI